MTEPGRAASASAPRGRSSPGVVQGTLPPEPPSSSSYRGSVSDSPCSVPS